MTESNDVGFCRQLQLKKRVDIEMAKKLEVDGWTINDVLDLYKEESLFVDQRYQRKLVWSLSDKILFIDSLFQEFPIPNIMMVEYEDVEEKNNTYGIIDGLQRINAILSFMLCEFPVSVDGVTGYFDIKCASATFDLSQEGKLDQKEPVLDRNTCIKFRKYKLPVIATAHNSEKIDEIFKRLNSTGTKLSKHDLRQAGALNIFSQLVRRIACSVRGSKTMVDIVPVGVVPEISLSNKGLSYGIDIDKVFWRKQGILDQDSLRKSRDEEIIATLLGSFLLDRPITVITPSVLDNLYDENTEDGRIADNKLKDCCDNLETLFVQTFNEIDNLCDEAEMSFSELLAGDKRKSELFMIFFKVFLQIYFEGKAIGDYKDFAETLLNAKESILSKFSESNTVAYLPENNTIKLINDLIASHLVVAEPEYDSMTNEVINRLNMASIETKYTEYKIGLTFFNTPYKYRYNEGRLNYGNVSQIAKVASSMTNIPRRCSTPGMIIIGVSDNESDYEIWKNHFQSNAYKYKGHRVVGIGEEAKVHYNNIDNLLKAFNAKVDQEPISEELKEDLKNYDVLTIHGKTIIVITVTATSGQLYDGKKYTREGSELKEIIV